MTSSELAARLCDAHVHFQRQRLLSDTLSAEMAQEIQDFLALTHPIVLNHVVSREQIKATARTYAVDMPMAGGIPELVGEIARAIYHHPIQAQVALKDLISDKQMGELIDQLSSQQPLLERVLAHILRNPLLVDLASDLLVRGIKGYLAQGNQMAKQIPGASTLMGLGKSVLAKASSNLEETLDKGLQTYVHKTAESSLIASEKAILKRLSRATLAQDLRALWDDFKHHPFSELRRFVSADAVDDVCVVIYEAWRADLRRSPYYATLIDIGIDTFFDKYGEETLGFLLEEVGVTASVIQNEADRFAPPILKALDQLQVLEPLIRRQLAPFYASPACAHVLAEDMKSPS